MKTTSSGYGLQAAKLTFRNRRATSPFWRQRPSVSRHGSSKNKVYDPSVVVGASYSHADMLKFDELCGYSGDEPVDRSLLVVQGNLGFII